MNKQTIDSSLCEKVGDYGWAYTLPLTVQGNTNKFNNISCIRVFENGMELPFMNSDIYYIKTFGRGRYTCVDNKLYFSASDNTPILDNRRVYEVDIKERRIIYPRGTMNFPYDVGIEITNICNARCIYCPLYHNNENRLKYPLTYMDMDMFTKIIDELSSWAQKPYIYLNNGGEPLLDKMFEERLAYCVKKGLSEKIMLQTNGQFLTAEKSRLLLEAGISYLIVAFDGSTKEKFEQQRVNCTYETVLNNIIQFAKIRDRGSYGTGIRIKAMRTKLNDTDITEIWKLFKPYLNHPQDSFLEETAHTWNEKYLMSEDFLHNENLTKVMQRPCRMAYTYLPIYTNGMVGSCSIDYNNELYGQPVGSVESETISDIWFGKTFRKIRKTMDICIDHKNNKLLQKLLPKNCRSCYMMYYDENQVPRLMDDRYIKFR